MIKPNIRAMFPGWKLVPSTGPSPAIALWA
jgi:hypothetical protein